MQILIQIPKSHNQTEFKADVFSAPPHRTPNVGGSMRGGRKISSSLRQSVKSASSACHLTPTATSPNERENFHAETLDGTPLPWLPVNKASWQVETGAVTDFRASYEVYANDLTVRTAHLDESHGYFNGTNVFMYLDGFKEHPVSLSIQAPEGWHSSIALPQNSKGEFEAETYDLLVDSPAEIGTHRVLTFTAVGKPHEIALWVTKMRAH